MTTLPCRPAITLVEFEQIYDEYLYLCNDNQSQVNAEEISLSKLKASHFLTQEEKDAILNQNLSQYLEQLDRELFKNDVFEEVKEEIEEASHPAEGKPKDSPVKQTPEKNVEEDANENQVVQ